MPEGRIVVTAGFNEYGEIVGAVMYREGERAEGKARAVLRNEVAPRLGMKCCAIETLLLDQWLEIDQFVQLDVGLDNW
jgi:hypothetical protein